MRVKMLQDAPGSPDGVTVNEYTDGEVYEVTQALGDAFVNHGLAEAVEDAPAVEPVVEPESTPEPDTKQAAGPEEKK